MTTFVYKTLGFAVKADTQVATPPVIGVNTAGELVMAVAANGGAGKSVKLRGTDGTVYYIAAVTTAP